MTAIRLLLVDDHPAFRSGVADLLAAQDDLEVVGEAADGAEAVEMARELVPDVVLMDLSMPRVDGLEATRRIKAEVPSVRVVILTLRDLEGAVVDAVRSGAQGYLLKSVDPSAMLRTIREVARGEASISPAMASRLLQGLEAESRTGAHASTPGLGLTPREQDALRLIARGTHTGAIADALGVAEKTAGRVLLNILEKLYLESRVEAAARSLRDGRAKRLPPDTR